MLADFLTSAAPALPLMFLAGLCFILAGLIWYIAIRRHELVMGPDPVIPSGAIVLQRADAYVIHSEVLPQPNYHREYPVVPHIPGATPQAGPVCPVCGGPFHPVCPNALEVRTEERVLAPQLAAVARFLDAVDQATEATEIQHAPIDGLREERIEEEVSSDLLQRVRDGLADLGPGSEPTQPIDLCPLTTQDIEIVEVAPFFQETFVAHPSADLGTQELSGSMARAKERVA